MIKINIPDLFAEIVTKTSEAVMPVIKPYLPPLVNKLNYMHGHPVEIITRLQNKDKTGNVQLQNERYPLIALFQDLPERPITADGSIVEVELQIIIANLTKNTYTAPERYQLNFNPVLKPVYCQLVEQIKKHKATIVNTKDGSWHTAYDRLYWGTQSDLLGNQVKIFNDYLDAIEMQNVRLRVNTETALCQQL
ncbi:MAG: hypothetical protein SFU21_15150 [Flavihumibacter sp.]|nr:hypothetical protein [Flavihumibacter sp.]